MDSWDILQKVHRDQEKHDALISELVEVAKIIGIEKASNWLVMNETEFAQWYENLGPKQDRKMFIVVQ